MLNRVKIDTFKETVSKVEKNPSLSKKILEVEGKWKIDVEIGPQFETKLKTERAGEILLQTDETIILGGGGTAMNPVQLCIAGLLACYAATFAKWAAMAGVVLKSFKIKGTANMDMSAAFGISENSPLENLQMELMIDSDTTLEKLFEINELAKKRCPGYYCLTHEIIPQINIKKIRK